MPVEVSLDGRVLPAYVRAYVAAGRIYAPVQPLLARVADRIWFVGGRLVFTRDGRTVSIRLAVRRPDALGGVIVAVAPLLRGLGAQVRYEGRARRLLVSLPREPVAWPTPFSRSGFQAAPSSVFTPTPIPTPRPHWSGSPLPRRTPLPFPPPRRRR